MIKTSVCPAEGTISYIIYANGDIYISTGCCLDLTSWKIEEEEIAADNLDNIHKKIFTDKPIHPGFMPGEFDFCFSAKECPTKNEITCVKVGAGVCNCKCKMCEVTDMNVNADYKKRMFFKILEEYKKHGGYDTLLINICGEIFCWKEEFLEFIESLTTDHFKEIFVFTNGTLIEDEDIERLKKVKPNVLLEISIDSVQKEKLESIRIGTNYEKVMNTIIKLKEAGLLKGCNYVIQKENLDELEEAYEFFKEKGVETHFICEREIVFICGHYFDMPKQSIVTDKRRIEFMKRHPDTILFNEVK